MMTSSTSRPPAVSGMFYPDDPRELRDHINIFMNEQSEADIDVPKAIIVPHAGTVYSGSIAAAAYRRIQQSRHVIKTVVLLGPTHRFPLRGLGLPSVQIFQTPLGPIDLDTQAMEHLANTFSQVKVSDLVHEEEHSLEVQLPFLQCTLSNFRLIPLAVGEASEIDVAEVLNEVWGGAETLIVISSDLSHFHKYKKARRLDEQTAHLIETFQGGNLQDHSACGRIPIRGLLRAARSRNMTIRRFDLRNSGDTAGSRDQVVGYGSWGLYV